MELDQRKKAVRTPVVVVVVALALITFVWVGLDLSALQSHRERRPRWSAADSAVVPEEFYSIWFPKISGGSAISASGIVIDTNRAIHVSFNEIQNGTFHVLGSNNGEGVDVSKELWTPRPPDQPRFAQNLVAHKALWSSFGFDLNVSFQMVSPELTRVTFGRNYDRYNTGIITKEEFVYDVVKKPEGWSVVPKEWWYKQVGGHQSGDAGEVEDFVFWCIRTGIRFGLSIVLFVPILLVMDSMERKNIVVRWILRECLYWWLPKRFRFGA